MTGSAFVLPRPVLLVLAALGLLFAIDLFALAAQREVRQAAEELGRRTEALDRLQGLPAMASDMQSGMRGYLLTGSSSALNRYRRAADAFAPAAAAAVSPPGEDAIQQRRVTEAAAAAREWVENYASPLVVKRGGVTHGLRDMEDMLAGMRRNPGEGQIDHIVAQLEEAVQAERVRVADARAELKRRLDEAARWMRGRAIALLVALAGLALALGRMLAKLVGQTRSREAAESAMRTSAATLRAMSDASPLGMFLADGTGACVQSNPAFERITGLPEAAVLGTGWQATLHPDDRERVVAAWTTAAADGAPFASVHRFVHRNGKVVWASMKSARMSDGDQLIGYACSIEDVSERREAEEALRTSEERLHLALESSRLALYDWHVPSGEVFLSREWNALTGYGPQSMTTTARRVNDLVHPADRDAVREAIVAVFKTNKPITRVEFRIETRSGQWRRVHFSGRVTERDAVGRAVRLTGTITAMD